MTDSSAPVERTMDLPRLGETMDSGKIVAWHRQPGERFSRGDVLLEVETDKTVVEVPALVDGFMVRHLAGPGDEVPVETPIAIVVDIGGGAGAAPPQPTPHRSPVSAPIALTPVPEPRAPEPEIRHGPGLEPEPDPEPETEPEPSLFDLKSSEPRPAPLSEPREAAEPAEHDEAKREELPDRPADGPDSPPSARRLAERLGFDFGAFVGSGPRGRVQGDDKKGFAGASKPEPPPVPPSHIAVAQGRFAIRRWQGGDRGTALMVHGFAGDLSTWAATAGALAERGHDVVAVDLPRHGATVAAIDDPRDAATALAEVASALGLAGIHLVGHSLGGAIATVIAAREPALVASLTLISPFGLGTEIDQGFIDGVIGAETAEALERELRKTTDRPLAYTPSAIDAILARHAESGRREGLAAVARRIAVGGVQQMHILPELASIQAPARVVVGRRDRITPWTQALRLPGRVALHAFDTGHLPHWEDAGGVIPLLSRFPG